MPAHRYPVRVYYEDTDAGGVVYHAAYLRFAERARTEAMRAAGAPHADLVAEHGVSFMVRRIEMEYLRPAGPDALIEVVTETLRVGGASVDVRQSFLHGGEVLATLRVTLACVRARDGRPGRIPARWRRALAGEQGG